MRASEVESLGTINRWSRRVSRMPSTDAKLATQGLGASPVKLPDPVRVHPLLIAPMHQSKT
jgi:hypothetical protein